MIDPFGLVLGLIRDDPTVAGIAGDRVSSRQGLEPPSIRLTDLVTTRRPFGPGSGRLGMLGWTGAAICYGPDAVTGDVTAYQLAAAVSDALHNHRPHTDASGRLTFAVYASDIDGVDRDPDTDWPMYTVPLYGIFAAEAVA